MANTPYVTTDQRLSASDLVTFADTLTSSSPFGFSSKNKGDELIATCNAIIALLKAAGTVAPA